MDFAFDRAEEMLTGVLFPIVILTIWEIYALAKGIEDERHTLCKNLENKADLSEQAPADNSQSLRVIGIGVMASGVIVFTLGLMAQNGTLLVCSMASVLILLGLFCIYKSKK